MSYDRDREIDGEEKVVRMAFCMRRQIAKLARDEAAEGIGTASYRHGQLDALEMLVAQVREYRAAEARNGKKAKVTA